MKTFVSNPLKIWALAFAAIGVSLASCDQTATEPVQAAAPGSEPNDARDESTADHTPAEDIEPAAPVGGSVDSSGDVIATTTIDTTAQTAFAPAGSVEVTNANVTAIDVVEVPSQEAGVVRSLAVTEGDAVDEDALLAQIDDDRSQIELQLAIIERDTSKEQAENEVNKKYAIAAEKVAKLEHEKAIEANLQAAGTFPKIEVDRLRLVHQRSKFQVDQAIMEMKIAGMTLKANEARVKAATKSLARRKIVAPRTGVVVKLYKHAGEWVDPGDPVLQVVRSDRMRVEGYMNAREHDPHEVAGARVVVTVQLARGRKETFEGRLKLPDLTIEADGKYRVWAEVTNRKQGRAWLLRPGQGATMTVTVPQ